MLLIVITIITFWHYINFDLRGHFLPVSWHCRALTWLTVTWKKRENIVLKSFGMLSELYERRREHGLAIDAGQCSYCFNLSKELWDFSFLHVPTHGLLCHHLIHSQLKPFINWNKFQMYPAPIFPKNASNIFMKTMKKYGVINLDNSKSLDKATFPSPCVAFQAQFNSFS